jgi:hypothetical protein
LEKLGQKFGLPIAAVMQLDGVSGFKGEHITDKTALGLFLMAVNDGLVAKGSILVADDATRLSRMEVDESSHLLTGIIRMGVGVYFTDSDTLLEKGGKGLQVSLLVALIHFSEGHTASKQKQRFTYKQAAGMAQAFINGDESAFIENRAVAIKSVGNHPWWIDCSDGTVRPHVRLFPVARKVVEMMLKGMGSYKVLAYLNEHHEPPKPSKAKSHKDQWTVTAITKFASRGTDALTGTRVLRLEHAHEFGLRNEYVLDGYFPEVATLAEVKRIREQRKARTGSRSKTTSTLLAGINVMKCGYCGYAMTAFTHRKKLRAKCNGGGTGSSQCKAWGFNLSRLEDLCCRLLVNHVWLPEQTVDQSNDEAEIQVQIDLVKQSISETNQVVIDGTASMITVAPVLEELNIKLSGLKEVLEQVVIKGQARSLNSGDFERWQNISPNILELDEVDLRSEIKELMRISLNQILCYRGEKERQQRFRIILKDGTEYTVWNYTNKVVLSSNALSGVSDYLDKEHHLYRWAGGPKGYELEIESEFEAMERGVEGVDVY